MMSPLRICIRIICTLYCAFMILVFWIIYRDYYPSSCALDNKNCLQNYVAKTPDPLLKLWVYSSTSQSPNGSDLYPVWELDDFKANESFTKDVTVRLPLGLHNNGTMFVHVFVTPVEGGGRGEGNPFDADWVVNQTGIITHTSRQAPTHQNTSDSAQKKELVADFVRTSHWRSHLKLNVMTTDVNLDIGRTPILLENYIRPYEDQYLPIIVINDYSFRTKGFLPLNKTCKEMPLTITYTPASYGTLALRMSMEAAWNKSSSDNMSEMKSRIREAFINNVPFFLQSITIVLFCLLLWLLSFESDVSFWEERETMAGLSTQTVVWSSIHTMVICLKIMDREKSSFDLHVTTTVFMSIALTIEIWKLFKVFKARICWTEWRLVCDNAGVSDKERETQELDSQAMSVLSYLLYPSWVGIFICTLQQNFQQSWYFLCLKTLADGFRCFGWLYNLPQVFINYKLKSVADLPWKVLIYRALCIFMLKVFFMTMIPFPVGNVFVPEDIIFVIYLFQRCLYNN